MPELVSLTLILTILKITGGLATLCTLMFGVFKIVRWIKHKFTSIDANVIQLKKSMDDHIGGLREDIKIQTATLATALQEQRADFRTFCAPSLLMMNQQLHPLLAATPVRAKRAAKKVSQ